MRVENEIGIERERERECWTEAIQDITMGVLFFVYFLFFILSARPLLSCFHPHFSIYHTVSYRTSHLNHPCHTAHHTTSRHTTHPPRRTCNSFLCEHLSFLSCLDKERGLLYFCVSFASALSPSFGHLAFFFIVFWSTIGSVFMMIHFNTLQL